MAQTLGQKIRAARESKEMTRKQLAKKLKITAPYLGGLECDSIGHRFSYRLKEAVAKLLRVRLTIGQIDRHNKRVQKYKAQFN